jgi:hypothetical protein
VPGIYLVACSSCDFEHRASTSVTIVRLLDDTEEICPHPAERMAAEDKTGEAWEALVAAGRIGYRYAAFCGDCGALGHYDADAARRSRHVWSIVRQPKARELAGHCVHCGSAELHLIASRHVRRVGCPRCGAGQLRSELIARA